MDEHTPGVLEQRSLSVYAANNQRVTHCGGHGNDSPTSEANARRIVACWNACKGIETEILETLVDHGVSLNTATNIATAEARANEAEAHLDNVLGLLEGYAKVPKYAQGQITDARAFLEAKK